MPGVGTRIRHPIRLPNAVKHWVRHRAAATTGRSCPTSLRPTHAGSCCRPASKASQLADHSVCTTWGVNNLEEIFLLHVFRERLGYGELKQKVREMANMHKAGTVVIEDSSAGIQQIQELTREGFALIVPVKPKGDKTMRMAALTLVIEEGRVFIPMT